MHMRSFIAAGLAMLLPGIALAAPRDPAAAEALFRAARGAIDKGDYATACPKFEESNRLDPQVGTVFNLADCDEHLGKVATAWQLFKEVAQRLPQGDERVAMASSRATALEKKLPRVVLRATSPLPPDLLCSATASSSARLRSTCRCRSIRVITSSSSNRRADPIGSKR